MILVVGGAFQGKRAFVAEMLKQENLEREDYADGREDPVSLMLERKVINRFQELAKRFPEPELMGWIDKLIEENPEAVVIMDEVGSGIVPIDEAERKWREVSGRLGQKLAKMSAEVYRVICGIGTRIR